MRVKHLIVYIIYLVFFLNVHHSEAQADVQINRNDSMNSHNASETNSEIPFEIDESDYPDLDKFNHQYSVDLVPQVTGVTCWAASTAMIVGWADEVIISVNEVVEGVGYWARYHNDSYTIENTLASSDLNMFEVWGLVPDTRYDFSLSTISDLLWNYGPLWIASDEDLTENGSAESHIRVIAGISGDGSSDGTLFTIYDPWDRSSRRFRQGNTGSVYQESYTEFIAKMRHLVEKEHSRDAIYLAHL